MSNLIALAIVFFVAFGIFWLGFAIALSIYPHLNYVDIGVIVMLGSVFPCAMLGAISRALTDSEEG